MNSRITELFKNHESISKQDLSLLKSEIETKPYMQSLRALYLYGIHKFEPENYQQELSRTAAYTTDKKVLYHLINGEKLVETVQFSENKTPAQPPLQSEILSQPEYLPQPEPHPKEPLKVIFVNGKRNRLLFEGEENFMDHAPVKIDLEATKEAGVLVTEKPNRIDEVTPQQNTEKENVEVKENSENLNSLPSFTVEKVIDEKELSKDSEAVKTGDSFLEIDKFNAENVEEKAVAISENSAEINFHGTEDFLPKISINPPKVPEKFNTSKSVTNRHEDEMQKLLAEVEAKIKANKKPVSNNEKEEEIQNFEVNFAENHDQEVIVEIQNSQPETVQTVAELPESKSTSWKPMSLETLSPDSSVRKKENQAENSEEEILDKKTETNISTDKNEKVETAIQELPISKEINTAESNVPKFINTWQAWLKLGKKDETGKAVNEESKIEENISKETVNEAQTLTETEDKKDALINKFIETEPKISKLKEESSYEVKEKSGDISHLMTETLANIYAEQRLYAKAIKAFEVLKEKYPEKKEIFSKRIAEIKEQRNNSK